MSCRALANAAAGAGIVCSAMLFYQIRENTSALCNNMSKIYRKCTGENCREIYDQIANCEDLKIYSILAGFTCLVLTGAIAVGCIYKANQDGHRKGS